MFQEEDIPESLEDLKKEIEELEESLEKMSKEITIIETEKPSKVKPEEIGEESESVGFSFKAIIIGYIIYTGIIIGLGILVATLTVENILQLLIVATFLAVPALNVALGQTTISDPGIPNNFVELVNKWIYNFNKLDFLKALDPYGLLIIVGMLPAIISGVVAGIISKDKAYGFAAGVFVWVLSLIVAIVILVGASNIIGISYNIASDIMNMITLGYLSALFLAIFGVLGGSMKGQ